MVNSSTSARQLLHNLDRLLSLDDPGVIATATNLGLSRSAILRLTHSHATATRSALHRSRIPLYNIPRVTLPSSTFLCHRHFVNLWYYLPSELYIQHPGITSILTRFIHTFLLFVLNII